LAIRTIVAPMVSTEATGAILFAAMFAGRNQAGWTSDQIENLRLANDQSGAWGARAWRAWKAHQTLQKVEQQKIFGLCGH